MLQDVLYVGDLDAQALQKQPTNLSEYVTTWLEVHQLTARTTSVNLALDLPPEPLYARIHREKFSRVLDNLLLNALKFTPAGGTVTVSLCASTTAKPALRCGTRASAPRASSTPRCLTSSTPAGLQGETTTGLGLFIAKQIVELHGGYIWLESREQEVSSFFVELP